MTLTAKSPEFYRQATEDVAQNRNSDLAKSLVQEIQAEIRAGQPLKNVRKTLISRGAPDIWAGQVVNMANRANWAEILAAAEIDLSHGRLASTNIAAGLRLADALLIEDTRKDTLKARLRQYGATEQLAQHLITHDSTRANQRATATIGIVLGLLLVGFSGWVLATQNSNMPSGALLPGALGLGVIGKSIAALMGR